MNGRTVPVVLKTLQALFVIVGTWLLVCSFLTVVLQDLRIFPAVKDFNSAKLPPPEGVEEVTVQTTDGETLQAWRLAGEREGSLERRSEQLFESKRHEAPSHPKQSIAIIFRGNDGPLHDFFHFQEWFRERGITSYLFNYRGYGKSSGWPSEHGLERDGEAVLEYLQRREGALPQQLILLGYSIGTGPASAIAKRHRPSALILLAPFVDLPSVVAEIPLLRYLKHFLWYSFPVKSNVSALDSTCLAVAHGEFDQIIPVSQGREVFSVFKGAQGEFLYAENGDHLNIFGESRARLSLFLERCQRAQSVSGEVS